MSCGVPKTSQENDFGVSCDHTNTASSSCSSLPLKRNEIWPPRQAVAIGGLPGVVADISKSSGNPATSAEGCERPPQSRPCQEDSAPNKALAETHCTIAMCFYLDPPARGSDIQVTPSPTCLGIGQKIWTLSPPTNLSFRLGRSYCFMGSDPGS